MMEKYLRRTNIPNWFISVKMICLFIIVFSFFLFNSCQEAVKPKCKDCLILHASLDEEVISLERLFDKIELIPLETTDNSLIRYIGKYEFLDGKHFILDDTQYILFIFDEQGNYINRIARVGQGPGEYRYIYDFSLNPQKGQIEMLSPYRLIYCYDFDGKYLKTYDMSEISSTSIQRMQILDNENYIIWYPPLDGFDGLYIISQETGELVNSFWQDIYIINSWSSDVFYKYNDEIYFYLHLYNTVYKVNKEGVEEAYEWYFGDKTMDISLHEISTGIYNMNKDNENLMKKIEDDDRLYQCIRNYQNKHYYYVQLRFELKKYKHLFYNKITGKSCFFESIIEDFPFNPVYYFQDEYMIGTLNYEYKDKLLNCPLIDEENRQKLLSFKEDDNPYLIKYYFKDN